MHYENTVKAIFLSRPNRFIAQVLMGSREETVHVKNTGRCKELLLPGRTVILALSDNPARKTRYDLIAVYREERLINMDSQAPNKAAMEYIPTLFPHASLVRPEYRLGDSRLDFYIETERGGRVYMEVKGVTLFEDDVALFPDAPTERGVKHIRELISCAEAGDEAVLLFVIQAKGLACLKPNDVTHPAFGAALREAAGKGVRVLAVDCLVTEDAMTADKPVPVVL